MNRFILVSVLEGVATITLNRPERLNAWHAPMRDEIIAELERLDADPQVRALIMTGAGDRAFCAGQDLEEAHGFDVDRAEAWIREWERFYSALRALTKPLVMAINGVAAGSAFQVALLGDIRVGHPGVRMGQPEIDAGIASVTGPWVMKEMLGMSRTIELTLTARLMEAAECNAIGLLHHVVPQEQVMPKSREIAMMLAKKPPVAMRLDKQRFREMTEVSFREAIEAAIRIHRESYASGEPVRMMEAFFAERGKPLDRAANRSAS